MSQVIHHEILFFFISVLSGVLVLCGYDQLRVLRRVLPHNAFFQSLEDFFYWTLAGIFCFGVAFRENSGAIRGFSLAAMALGMWFYHVTVSRWVVKSESFVLGALLFPFMFVSKKIRYFWQKMLKKVWNCFRIKRTGKTGRKRRGIHESKKKKTQRQPSGNS